MPATLSVIGASLDPALGSLAYRVHQLTKEGNTTGVQAVDGALDSFVVAELTAETDYCFQLEAVRGGQNSPLSAQQCAKTGVAPPPTGVSTAVSETAASTAAIYAGRPISNGINAYGNTTTSRSGTTGRRSGML